MKSQIPVFKPLIEKEEIAAAVESLQHLRLGSVILVRFFRKVGTEVVAVVEFRNGNSRRRFKLVSDDRCCAAGEVEVSFPALRSAVVGISGGERRGW